MDAERERVTGLLTRDVVATVGAGHEGAIGEAASKAQALAVEADEYAQRLVDDVQQYFHDTFVDTTWPRCPRHPNHPMWFHGGWWWCDRERVRIARLGDLSVRDREGR